MQRLLSRPIILNNEQTMAVNKLGPNFQNFCSWYCVPKHWSVMDVDCHLQAQNTSAIASVPLTFQAQLMSHRMYMQFKNMCNKRVDVTMYELKLKRDRAAAASDMFGLNPAWLQAVMAVSAHLLPTCAAIATANGLPATVAVRTTGFDTHNVDPKDYPGLNQTFSIKQKLRKFLAPGEFSSFTTSRKGRKVSKVLDGVNTSSSYTATYDHMKWMGPLLLFRVQGSNVHDETLYTAAIGAGLDNTVLNTTMSGFNVEFYSKRTTKSIGVLNNGLMNQYGGYTSAALPVIAAVANEQGWEIRAPQEDAVAA